MMNYAHDREGDPMLEIRHLQLVAAVAAEGGVTRAGRLLHLSQSALSHQLRDAEERLRVRLFDRIGKRMVLTPAGERLLRSARLVLEELRSFEDDVRRGRERPRELLRLTTECNTVYHWLPSRLRLLERAHPDVDVQVLASASDDPLPSLLEGQIDLAIVHRPVRDSRLRSRALFRDELVVVLPPGHRLSAKPFVAAEDLAPEHLILYSIPREANLVFREVLIPAGVSPARVTHIQLTEAIVELVKAGLGVSVLARWSVAPSLERREPRPGAHLLDFVDLLARHPLPLGRNARERRRIATLVAEPDRRSTRASAKRSMPARA
jgi:LysR family transcriptional regulator for metE and metH